MSWDDFLVVMDCLQTKCEYFAYITSVDLKRWQKLSREILYAQEQMFDLMLTFCSEKSILHLRGEHMSNIGRLKGKNNKSIRMDEQKKTFRSIL